MKQVNESDYQSICPIEDTVAAFCQLDQPGRVASSFADTSGRPVALNCERRLKIAIGIRQRQASIALTSLAVIRWRKKNV
jgi:hypothetical protein